MTTTKTYRATLTDQTGTEHVTWLATQDEIDALTDQHEARDSAYPAGCIERERKDGTWTRVGGWDVRPRQIATPAGRDYTAERSAEMAAVAAINDAADRRQNRRDYYLRTGR